MIYLCIFLFQSTLSVRRATVSVIMLPLNFQISIHALREESDSYAPHLQMLKNPFQSTLSVRRATFILLYSDNVLFIISIHALREESDFFYNVTAKEVFISIHALREESDSVTISLLHKDINFNPRSP